MGGCAAAGYPPAYSLRVNAPAGKRPFGLGLGAAYAALHRLPMRGRDTLLRSSRLRERPQATIPAPDASQRRVMVATIGSALRLASIHAQTQRGA